MGSLINNLRKANKYYLFPVATSLLLSLSIMIFYILNLQNLPQTLPLFYSLTWGETQLVNKLYFLLLPGLILTFTALHLLFSYYLHQSQVVLKRVIMVSLVVINLILAITAFNILFIFF